MPDQQIGYMIFSTILGTVLGWLSNMVKEKSAALKEQKQAKAKEDTAMKEALEQNRSMLGELMFYRLEDLHRRYVINGEDCSATEKQQVERIYRSYHEILNLNGAGTKMYQQIMSL